ncbi:conserved hypothetical protein [Vibrio phage 501E54-1]|nr:conserved hypothetical protein [Vibrio phage 501E54-1]
MWIHKGITYNRREDLPESLLQFWEDNGKKFGYPKCCRDAFRKGEQVKSTVFSGTGFLPCKCCNKKDPREVLKSIDNNRELELKFPFLTKEEDMNPHKRIRYEFISNMRESYQEEEGV